MKWETEVGNPSKLVSKEHNTDNSARHRLVVAMQEMQEFGKRFNLTLEASCVSTIEEIKNTNIKVLPLNDWRGWSVKDDYSGVTLVTRIRRTM